MLRKKLVWSVFPALILFQGLQEAAALPAFARSEGVSCSTCHTAWPQLNDKGRKYKENGYRFGSPGEDDKSLSEYFEDGLPIGAVVTARPYDKKKSGKTNNRALHEVELFAAGSFAKNWSGVLELEAEDETDFNFEMPWARLSYNYSPALNVHMAKGTYFDTDGYGLLEDKFRMTRGHVKVLDSAFGGADGVGGLRSRRQLFGISGRTTDKLFYNVSWSGLAGSAEGKNAKNFTGQLAYDVTDDINVSAFAIKGSNGVTNQDFSRNGLSLVADVGATRLHGAYVQGKDDIAGGTGQEKNNALSVQAMHVFKQGKRPNWVPIVRYDKYEQNDGNDNYTEMTLNLTHYFKQNIKGYVEYWKQLDTPTGVTEDDRVTAQLSVGF